MVQTSLKFFAPARISDIPPISIFSIISVSFLVELKEPKEIHKMSDHALFLFNVNSYKNSKNEFLKFNDLIEKKIIL